MAYHEFEEISHNWLSLHMEILHHFVDPLASNEADDVIVNTVTDECHGACCSRGSCRDVLMREPQMGSREEFYGGLKVGRDHFGGHIFQCPRGDLKRARGVLA